MAEHPAIPALSKYYNKNISLLSTSAVRYVGQLHTVDPDEPSISLKNVQCLGTEDRRQGQQAIAASTTTYEFIRFRANNIKSLHLEKNNQKIDLNKEILEPLRQYADSQHNQQETQQTASNKTADKQRNKPSIVNDEPKRKVGVPQQNYGAPYDYYSQRSPQYASINQYEYGVDAYPMIPSPYQTAQHGMYSPNYPYDDPNYSQNINFSQIAPPQPPSSYYPRDGGPDAILPNNEYYYQQQQSSSYGFAGPHPSAQSNVPFTNQSSQRYNRPPNYGNYRQYAGRNYDYQQQSNTNRTRYPSERRQDQRGERGGYGGMQGNQRYYNNANQRQGLSSGGRNRYDATNYNNNQAPGTGAYLDRRLRGTDLNISTADFHFGSEEKIDDKKNDASGNKEDQKQSSTTKKEETSNGNTESADAGKDKNQINEEKQKETSNSNENATDDNTRKQAYDKNRSFFDSITTDADVKKQQKQVDLEEQRKNDAETFGTVAESYRSRHGQNQQNNENPNYYRRNNAGNQRKFNQQQPRNNYGYNQQQKYNNYRPQYDNNQFNTNNQQRWVQKRGN